MALATGMAIAWGLVVQGQEAAAHRQAPAPAPRWPDGRISFSGTPEDVGNWEGPANASIFFNIVDGKKVAPAAEPADESHRRRDSVQARHARAL